MPKLAATLASILLIASSIGVNITRYPQVGRTIDPAPAGAAETASPLQTANESPRVEKAVAELTPGKPGALPTSARDTRLGAANGEPPADRLVAVVPRTTPAPMDKSVPIVDVRPIAPEGAPTSRVESPANASGFQRLPPVEPSGQNPFEVGHADDGANYPTTATP